MKVARPVRRGADGKVPSILKDARQLACCLPYLILAAIVVAAVTIWNTLGGKLASKLTAVSAAVR